MEYVADAPPPPSGPHAAAEAARTRAAIRAKREGDSGARPRKFHTGANLKANPARSPLIGLPAGSALSSLSSLALLAAEAPQRHSPPAALQDDLAPEKV